eukprot:1145394-Pelagomonas_calceolata.AAC.8
MQACANPHFSTGPVLPARHAAMRIQTKVTMTWAGVAGGCVVQGAVAVHSASPVARVGEQVHVCKGKGDLAAVRQGGLLYDIGQTNIAGRMQQLLPAGCIAPSHSSSHRSALHWSLSSSPSTGQHGARA